MLTLKSWATTLKKQALTLYFVARDERTPFIAKLLALLVAAYAFSLIDLIPDFIPVLGYLDNLMIIPLGIALVLRLTPDAIKKSALEKAHNSANKPTSYFAAVTIVLFWVLLVLLLFDLLQGRF